MKYICNTIILLTGYFFHIFQDFTGIYSLDNAVNYNNIISALKLNLFYFASAILVFYLAFYGARKKGTLVNMGE